MPDVSYPVEMTSLYRFIPRFGSSQEALLQRPAAPIRPSRAPPSPGPGSPDGDVRTGG